MGCSGSWVEALADEGMEQPRKVAPAWSTAAPDTACRREDRGTAIVSERVVGGTPAQRGRRENKQSDAVQLERKTGVKTQVTEDRDSGQLRRR